MTVHTAILCDKCGDVIGTRTSTYERKVMILKDEKHRCNESLFTLQTSAACPIVSLKPECNQ